MLLFLYAHLVASFARVYNVIVFAVTDFLPREVNNHLLFFYPIRAYARSSGNMNPEVYGEIHDAPPFVLMVLNKV